ncbi:hypothetical protein LOTGIDRAFT_234410 [Lottia gigantea]|uniref:Death domain-containing protein n=1 Tax=Lottia gigantea TaxID=225164 RepID=V3ZCQ0_LOTGI|nr:hypothetical protein LOTGIDRAFT_234410 [Lottia gigantea]ESO88833.1 hypothetical protein LOTGIDRAFT_234410 [Lottia gigantea]
MNVTRHRPYTRSQGKQSCSEVEELTHEQHIRLKQLQDCSEEVDSNMMAELSKSWDRRFSKYGKLLQLDDACLKNIRDRVREDDSVKRREELYQMLLTWKEKTGDPSVKNLIRLLTACGDYSPIKPLLTPSYWTND